jgi:hypothetical protein
MHSILLFWVEPTKSALSTKNSACHGSVFGDSLHHNDGGQESSGDSADYIVIL